MRATAIRLLLALMLLLAGSARALAPVPNETGYLTDLTGIIEPAMIGQIQLRLAQYHIQQQRKISVLLVQETPGEELEAYADRVIDQWGLREVKNGGALVLWTAEGYILIRATERVLPRLSQDAQSEIISEWIVPAYAEGDAGRGILDGVNRMIAVIDGEPVGTRPSTPPPTDDAQAMIDEMLLLDPTDPVHVPDDVEPPLELPPWLDRLPGDLARITMSLAQNPGAGLRDLLGEARGQVRATQAQLGGLLAYVRGDTAEPGMLLVSRNAYVVLMAVLAMAALMLLRGAWVGTALLAGVGGSIALWVATGFTALAVMVLVLGMTLPLLRRLVRAVLSSSDGQDDEEVAADRMRAQIAALAIRPTPASASRATSVPVASSKSVTPSAIPPSAPTVPLRRVGPPSAQDSFEFSNLVGATFRHALGKARLWHLGVAIALAMLSVGLLVLAIFGVAIYFVVRRGVAYRFLEMGSYNNADIRRLLDRLPKPDPADLKAPVTRPMQRP